MAARKTSAKPTRVWKFAARLVDAREADHILMVANRYYNALIAIERQRHERYQAIRRQFAPELAAAEDEWEQCDTQIVELLSSVKRARQQHWRENEGERKRLLPEEVEAQVEALRAAQKRVATNAKTLRTAFSALVEPAREEFKRRTKDIAGDAGPRVKSRVNAEVLGAMLEEPQWSAAWAAIARSDSEAHAATLAARASCSLATGTYLQIEEAVQRAKKDSLPRSPRFRRFAGNGKLAVQLRGTTFADVLAGTTALALQPAPVDPSKRGDQSRMVVALLDQSIPRAERRKLTLTVKMHRRPPDDAEVKWAAVVVRRVGQRTTCELQLTLEHESFSEPKRPAGSRGPEHVRIGWARMKEGVRVARWADGDVVLPESILAQHEHAASVESAADRYFEHTKRMLRRWLRSGPHALTGWHQLQSDQRRAWLRRMCVAYAQWALDVGSIWKRWRTERLARGEDLYSPVCVVRRWLAAQSITQQEQVAAFALYLWARKDEHLQQLAVDSRRRFTARRDAFYRREAIRIATEFESVTVDAYRIASLKELPSLTMPGDTPREQGQHNAQAAAPGRFREILLEVMGPRCVPCERSGDGQEGVGARAGKVRSKTGVSASPARVLDV